MSKGSCWFQSLHCVTGAYTEQLSKCLSAFKHIYVINKGEKGISYKENDMF